MSNGISNQIQIAAESTYGTRAIPELSIPIMESSGIQIEQEANGVPAINTKPALHKDFVKGVRNYPGEYEMAAYPNSLGFLLYGAFGGISSSAVYGESSVYEHVLTEAISKPSFTVEQVIGDIEDNFLGYKVGGFTLSLTKDGPLTMVFPGSAKTHSEQEKTSINYETLKAFKWTDVSSITIGGTNVEDYLEEAEIEYSNGLATFHGFSGSEAEPTTHYVEPSEVTGSFTFFLDGSDIDGFRDTFKDQDIVEIVITISGESIGDSSNTALQLTIPAAVIAPFTAELGTSYNQAELEIIGSEDATDGLIKATLVNTWETYAA